jgi:hypothetical protein
VGQLGVVGELAELEGSGSAAARGSGEEGSDGAGKLGGALGFQPAAGEGGENPWV